MKNTRMRNGYDSSRREFLATATAFTLAPLVACGGEEDVRPLPTDEELLHAANSPLLKLDSLSAPILIESMDLLCVLHFASYIPNCDDHQEFKGTSRIPIDCPTSDLQCKNGIMLAPTGPGFGVTIDPEFVRKSKVIHS